MTRTISNSDDIIDSRDVIARIVELESERDDYSIDVEDDDDYGVTNITDDQRHQAWAAANEDDAHELKVLLALQDDASSSPDWHYGETLIADSYFQTYAEDLAEDCGRVVKDAPWPNSFIDWEAASEALKEDYTQVDFDGTPYWIRA